MAARQHSQRWRFWSTSGEEDNSDEFPSDQNTPADKEENSSPSHNMEHAANNSVTFPETDDDYRAMMQAAGLPANFSPRGPAMVSATESSSNMDETYESQDALGRLPHPVNLATYLATANHISDTQLTGGENYDTFNEQSRLVSARRRSTLTPVPSLPRRSISDIRITLEDPESDHVLTRSELLRELQILRETVCEMDSEREIAGHLGQALLDQNNQLRAENNILQATLEDASRRTREERDRVMELCGREVQDLEGRLKMEQHRSREKDRTIGAYRRGMLQVRLCLLQRGAVFANGLTLDSASEPGSINIDSFPDDTDDLIPAIEQLCTDLEKTLHIHLDQAKVLVVEKERETELEREVVVLREELRALGRESEMYKRDTAVLQDRVQVGQALLRQAQSEADALRGQVGRYEHQMRHMSEEIEHMRDALAAREAELAQAEGRVRQKEEELIMAQAREPGVVNPLKGSLLEEMFASLSVGSLPQITPPQSTNEIISSPPTFAPPGAGATATPPPAPQVQPPPADQPDIIIKESDQSSSPVKNEAATRFSELLEQAKLKLLEHHHNDLPLPQGLGALLGVSPPSPRMVREPERVILKVARGPLKRPAGVVVGWTGKAGLACLLG